LDYIPGPRSSSRYDSAMTDKTHQQELGKQINLIRRKDPTKEWAPEELAKELAIKIGSPGYHRIREWLAKEKGKPYTPPDYSL
jgi:hypothetical protein